MTNSTSSLLKNTKLSKIISVVNKIRTGAYTSTESVRPKLRWLPRKSTQIRNDIDKFALRVRFSTSLQKEELSAVLNKEFLLHKSSTLSSNEVEISPSENSEDVKTLLDELVRYAWDRRIGSSDGGKHLLNDALGGTKKKIVVEFGSPNIAKPLHMGHLRSTVTGHFVARICKAAGHDVTTMCFLGDWGTQFGLLQAGLAQWLSGDSVEKAVISLDLDSLLQYYIRAVKEQESNNFFAHEAREYSAALEREDPSALVVWSAIREKTLRHLESVWKQLGIHYDVIQGESEFATSTEHTAKTLEILKENKLSEVRYDKCTYAILPFERKTHQNQNLPLVKADGSSLYLLRDIAAALSRHDAYGFDQMIYVVDKRQANHFLNLFAILSELGFSDNKVKTYVKPERRVQHVSFGQVEGMSTRSGNAVLFSDVIRDGSQIMQENRLKSPNARNKEDITIATKLAISSLVVHFLRVRRNRDCHFDWTEALRSTGDTGVRLQYTHSRLRSLEERHEFKTSSNKFDADFNTEYILSDPLALDLALHLLNFEDALVTSYDELEPSLLLTYLFRLCDKISKALKELQVLSESNSSIANTRLLLFVLSRRTLAFGLDIIGIEPLDQI